MILERLGLRRKKEEKAPRIRRSEFLKVTPVRNPGLKWEKDEDGNIKLIMPLEQLETRKRKKGPSLFAPAPPKERKIQLDTVGSIVWELCDGKRTVKDIVEYMHEEYKLMRSEVEISLNQYFNMLSKRGLLAYMVPEEMRDRWEAIEKEEEKE